MKSYAQFETDLALLSLFPAVEDGCYIDVGASHPVTSSNTYLLYERGWRGICIEPTDKLLLHHEKRIGDIQLQSAVGQYDGDITFYECPEDTVSTVVLYEAEKRGKFVAKQVKIYTLATILRWVKPCYDIKMGDNKKYQKLITNPEVLSIDVEGYEKEVLEGCPFETGFRPKAIVLEACLPCTEIPSFSSWEHILHSYNYRLEETCGVNRIYVAS